jgi:2-polyprenyl-3-methyl-5-hydroxy-6-metoxy-1,4-benzoquinol methylase
MTKQELEKVFSYHKWRQKILINDAIHTPGHIDNDIWKDLGLPNSVNDLNILDIGSNDGQIAFEAEKRGAEKVYASDLYIDKLETMAMGWPIEGISILKDVKNSSIVIHKEGLFGLDSINDQFDIVILNNVLNWIGDIDLVIRTLAKLNFKSMYIADQFLTTKNTEVKRAPQTSELKAFKELCNKEYLTSKMKEFDIYLDKVTSFSIQEKYIKKFIEQNNITSNGEVNIYNQPDQNSTIIAKSAINSSSNYLFNDFYFVRTVGWVKKEDVLSRKNKVSPLLNIFYKAGLLKIYVFLKELFKNDETNNYVLVFKRNKH